MIAISLNNKSLLILFIFGYIVHIVVSVFKSQKRKEKIYLPNEIKKIIFLIYFWALLSCTLLPILVPPVGLNDISINWNVMQLFQYPDLKIWFRNVIGNVFLLMPLPFLIAMCLGKQIGAKKTLLVCLIVSGMIEILQLVENVTGLADFTSRQTDINDIILNVFGGMLGWMIYRVYDKLRN